MHALSTLSAAAAHLNQELLQLVGRPRALLLSV